MGDFNWLAKNPVPCIALGIGMPELRLNLAKQIRKWTHVVRVLFIVNDRPDIARLVEADGVHLGQDDMPVAHARRILGPDAIIGVSTHNLDQARQARTAAR